MAKIRWQKIRKKYGAPSLPKHIYPSQYATSTKYPGAFDGRVPPRGQREQRTWKCAQCGAPLEDTAELDKCWFCESDNFRGRKLQYDF